MLNIINFVIYCIIDLLTFFKLKKNNIRYRLIKITYLIFNLFVIGIFSILIIFLLTIQIKNCFLNKKLKEKSDKERKSVRSNELFDLEEKTVI